MAHSSKSKDIWFSSKKSRSVTGMGYNKRFIGEVAIIPACHAGVEGSEPS